MEWLETALKLTVLLFLGATVAQSVQWIWDSYQNQQWIYLAFALVSFVVVVFGLSEIIAEWRRLVKLKKAFEFTRTKSAINR